MRNLLFLLLILSTLSSCRTLFPNDLFRLSNDLQYYDFGRDTSETGKYVIKPGDRLDFRVMSRNGYELVDVLAGNNEIAAREILPYEVREDGFAELPLLGPFYLAGMNEFEAADALEEAYSRYFIDPYIIVRVSDFQAYVFLGRQTAFIVNLVRKNMTLVEVLADVGGLPEETRADEIRIIRGDWKNPQIIILDLSTVSGLTESNLIIEPNDIIYVTPTYKIASRVLRELTPVLALISSMTSLILLVNTIIISTRN